MSGEYTEEALRRLQLAELQILEAISSICSAHGITWFLDGGTALGAKRHHGFIPWDDDMDIGMLREDYDRFLEIAPAELQERGCFLVAPGTKGYAAQFSKVCMKGTRFWTRETLDAGFQQGIFVDVFPYDKVSATESVRKRQFSIARKWSRISYLYASPNVNVPSSGAVGSLERAACRIAHPVLRALYSEESIARRFDEAGALAASEEAEAYITFPYPYYEPTPAGDILPVSMAEFEGHRFPTYHNVVAYLESMYGSTWDQLPPESERKTHAPLVLDFGDGKNVLEQ